VSNSGFFFLTTYVLLWVLVLAQSALLFVLLRQIGHAYLSQLPVSEREGVLVGKPLPDLPVITADGARTLFSFVTARSYSVVVLVTPTCPICREAVDALRETTAELPWLGGTVLVQGHSLDKYAAVSTWGNVGGITDKGARQLRVRATPFAFVVNNAGQVVAKGVVNTTDDLHRLLEPAKDAVEAWRVEHDSAST
jgi:hypothetical protein